MFETHFSRAKLVLGAWILFLAGIIILADSGHGRRLFDLVRSVPGGDKAGHFLLFGILSFLVNLLLRVAQLRPGKSPVLKGSAIVMALVTIEECSQLFFRSRTFDLGDLAADALGIWTFGMLARHYLARQGLKLQAAGGADSHVRANQVRE